MANEMVVVNFETQLAELDKIQDTCKKLLSTKHYQAIGEAGIHAIMSRAKALGIHPFEALNGGFHCINGKVGMSTELMAALIRSRGHSIQKDPKSTPECVILHGKRKDNGDMWTCSFSKDDAITAGLWNTATWKKYPGVMLYNRCMSMLFRQLFPDLSLGAGYVEDEVREITKTGDYATIEADVKRLYKENEVVPSLQLENKPNIQRITESQADELSGLSLMCKADVSAKCWANVLKVMPEAEGWYSVTPEIYQRAKDFMIKYIELEKEKKQVTDQKEQPRSMDEVLQAEQEGRAE